MTRSKRFEGSVLLAAAVMITGCGGGNDDERGGNPGPMAGNDPSGQPATETNAAPVPCGNDTECPDGISCVFPMPGQVGYCDVDEMAAGGDPASDPGMPVSSATPAPCTTDEDCGPAIVCKHLEGDSGPGFCDVDEMLAPGEGTAGAGG